MQFPHLPCYSFSSEPMSQGQESGGGRLGSGPALWTGAYGLAFLSLGFHTAQGSTQLPSVFVDRISTQCSENNSQCSVSLREAGKMVSPVPSLRKSHR